MLAPWGPICRHVGPLNGAALDAKLNDLALRLQQSVVKEAMDDADQAQLSTIEAHFGMAGQQGVSWPHVARLLCQMLAPQVGKSADVLEKVYLRAKGSHLRLSIMSCVATVWQHIGDTTCTTPKARAHAIVHRLAACACCCDSEAHVRKWTWLPMTRTLVQCTAIDQVAHAMCAPYTVMFIRGSCMLHYDCLMNLG